MSSSTERIPVGQVVKPHGVAGGVVVVPSSDDPSRFRPGEEFGTTAAGHPALTVTSSSKIDSRLILVFEGIEDRDTAEHLRGALLTIAPDDRRALEPGEYWPDQLVGMTACDPDGRSLGKVDGIVWGAAQDRLVIVDHNGEEWEVPFVDELVPEVDVEGQVVVVSRIDGLLS